MHNQERKQLTDFLSQLAEVKLTDRNAEAEGLIREAVAKQPDAAYLLIQRCLLQDQALQQAQHQIAELQRQLQQSGAASGGFLQSDPWTQASAKGVPGAGQFQMPAAAGSPQARQALSQNPTAGFGASFLGNVASTAAGVVAGSFLFQGIGNLLGHHQPQSPWSPAGSGELPVEQTVINNYYGDDTSSTADDISADWAGDDGEISDGDWI